MSDAMPVATESRKKVDVPMEVFRPHADRARANHSQTLDQLAARGGLSSGEAAAILKDRPWGDAESGEEAWAVIVSHTVNALRQCRREGRDISRSEMAVFLRRIRHGLKEGAGSMDARKAVRDLADRYDLDLEVGAP